MEKKPTMWPHDYRILFKGTR